MLVAALCEHRGALRASLAAEYPRLPLLHEILADPEADMLVLADYVAHLPPGCALFRATGGAMAWSTETHFLAQLDVDLRVLAWQKTKDGQNGTNRPEPIRPPESVHEQRVKEGRAVARIRVWKRRAESEAQGSGSDVG